MGRHTRACIAEWILHICSLTRATPSSVKKELAVNLKPVHEQVVVVVGANSGIGRETALQFARRGANVVVAGRSLPALNELAAEIRARGGEATAYEADVSQ